MTWRGQPPVASRLAVLSYHSWDAPAGMLSADIRALRKRGWHFVSAREAVAFVQGRYTASYPSIALVTTDDGHPEDSAFRDELASEGCPGVTFVNVGRMESDRFDWYRRTHSDAWSVQDHSLLHRRHFVSGHLTGVFHGQKIGGLEYLGLPRGAPLLSSAGQLASRRFVPHPDTTALAAEWAKHEEASTLAGDAWRATLASRLRGARLAYRWRGRTFLIGTLESHEEYEERVRRDIREGRAAFERALGHEPTMFAYPWWQGSALGDRELAAAGYAMTLAGTNRLQGCGFAPYSVPRVVMDPTTDRPVDLGAIATRGRRDWDAIRSRVQQAAKRMIGVI